MFTGREYQSELSDVCQKLASEKNSDREVKTALMRLEWILWEAVRGALIQASALIGFSLVFMLSYALGINLRGNWTNGFLVVCLAIALALLIYGTLRLSLYLGLTKHVRSHRFGALDYERGS
ncbi:MAG: hypothetical protein IOC49_12500 [Methylobacterium sp.]|nr:hypothetical protein [Methylobacterium sp.]